MNSVTILWSMIAAATMTLAAVHGLVWILDRKCQSNLVFSLLAISVAGLAPAELGMMHAATAEEYAMWMRWGHIPLFFTVVGMVFFVKIYLGVGRLWLAWAIVLGRLAVLAINFAGDTNFTWREIISMKEINFLGEKVSLVDQAVVGSWQWVASTSMLLFTCFLIDAIVSLWRKGGKESRRRASVVGGGLVAFLIAASLPSQLAVWGVVKMPLIISPPFVIAVGAMGFELCHDIFVSRRLQLESEQLRQELALAGRVSLLGHLASALAHELNQPLSAILRNAEAAEMILQEDSPDMEELRAIVADIRKDDQRAGDVIDRLRALLKRRQVDLQCVPVDQLVQDVLTLVRPEAAARKVMLECEVAKDLPPVAGDRVHLSQVLLNLVINGMDALNGSTQGRQVLIAARQAAGGTVEVSVTDSGYGIAKEALDRVFEPFFTTKAHGFGIGLSVSRTIIEAHEGKIWAQNNHERGATFSFSLPVSAKSKV